MVIADGGKGATTHARHDDDAGDEDGDGDDDADNDDDEATMAATVQGGARLHQAGGVMCHHGGGRVRQSGRRFPCRGAVLGVGEGRRGGSDDERDEVELTA